MSIVGYLTMREALLNLMVDWFEEIDEATTIDRIASLNAKVN